MQRPFPITPNPPPLPTLFPLPLPLSLLLILPLPHSCMDARGSVYQWSRRTAAYSPATHHGSDKQYYDFYQRQKSQGTVHSILPAVLKYRNKKKQLIGLDTQ